MNGRFVGRPPKYRHIIASLEDEALYTPAAIARNAQEKGFLKGKPEEIQQDILRIRITMGRNSQNHGFPEEGDGLVTLWGQSPTPGWVGRRWKEAFHITEMTGQDLPQEG